MVIYFCQLYLQGTQSRDGGRVIRGPETRLRMIAGGKVPGPVEIEEAA